MLEAAGIALDDRERRGIVLRAIDKLDRLGADGVAALLGAGRKDESGDFTKGAGLNAEQVERVFCLCRAAMRRTKIAHLRQIGTLVGGSAVGAAGLDELEQIVKLLSSLRLWPRPRAVRYQHRARPRLLHRRRVRGAAHLPGAERSGRDVVFGSVAGGGRYDDLVARFTGQTVPATGISIGVSRLISALAVARARRRRSAPLVVVPVMDKAEAAASFRDGARSCAPPASAPKPMSAPARSATRSNMPTSAAPPSR